jgi:Zn finger protein HypA/HybF involved in hydrogenase expression
MIKYDEKKFIEVCSESNSMREASIKLGIHFNTFKRIALKLGCYSTNIGGRGGTKPKRNAMSLEEILQGKHPTYQTYKLKLRLISEGIKVNVCERCGVSEWNGSPLNCELDHIDGDRSNHRLENLKILCPNCHSQTPTFRSKNIK